MTKVLTLLSLLLLCVAIGCRSAPEKHYALKAEVIAVDPPRKLITVKHGAIPDLMPAMTMTYAVSDAKEIEHLQPGDNITADLVVSDNKGRLEKITSASRDMALPTTPK
jgi:Cu/Ag efflux protein CusF